MLKDPQILYMLINMFLMLFIGAVGWLLRRAINNSDEKIDQVVKEVKDSTKAMTQLQVLIVGDYLTRKEYAENQKNVSSVLEQLRENVHGLRGHIQTNATKIAMLEGMVKGASEKGKL